MPADSPESLIDDLTDLDSAQEQQVLASLGLTADLVLVLVLVR